MSEMVERVARFIFKSGYPYTEHDEFWPDRLDELVSGPPFNADGYRDMARAAIKAMREPTEDMISEGAMFLPDHSPMDHDAETCWQNMIDAALGKVVA